MSIVDWPYRLYNLENLPGHITSKQEVVSVPLSGHGAPLNWGGGFVHVRDRLKTPGSHVLEQDPQGSQGAHCPSTK